MMLILLLELMYKLVSMIMGIVTYTLSNQVVLAINTLLVVYHWKTLHWYLMGYKPMLGGDSATISDACSVGE